MRTRDLWFYKTRKRDGLCHLSRSTSLERLPEGPGSYIFGTSNGTRLIYPNGESPVYYIGQSGNLRNRIKRHLRRIARVNKEEESRRRYEYAAVFGSTVAWYLTGNSQQAKDLEADLIFEFYRSYFSIPIANGSWPTGS